MTGSMKQTLSDLTTRVSSLFHREKIIDNNFLTAVSTRMTDTLWFEIS